MGQSELAVQMWRIIGSAPYLLVVLVGIALCIACAGRSPRTALLVGIALFIHLVNMFVTPFVAAQVFANWPVDAEDQLNMRIFVNQFVYSIPSAAALGLMLWAAFQRPAEARDFEVVE
jgi:hypothetical protein